MFELHFANQTFHIAVKTSAGHKSHISHNLSSNKLDSLLWLDLVDDVDFADKVYSLIVSSGFDQANEIDKKKPAYHHPLSGNDMQAALITEPHF